MSKFKVMIEQRSKETLIVEAADEATAQTIAFDLSNMVMNSYVYDVQIEQLDDDDARQADNV